MNQVSQHMEMREVMNARQAAQYLGIGVDALRLYAAQNKVPAFRFGNRWRFKKSMLDAWMETQTDRVAKNASARHVI
jgi:excisionase family DNA binding protein